MADELLEFDPAAEASGSPLSIGPGTSYALLEHSYPAPPLNVLSSSSIDTEGEIPVSRRYGNRTITIRLDMVDAGGTLLAALQAKFAKLQREGGTLKRTMTNGAVRTYDIVAADGWDPVYDIKYYLGDLSEVTLTLPARPLSRGAVVDHGDNVETTNPALIFSETGVAGDVEALGRLVIDNDVASDQWWMTWGIESNRHYTFTDSTGSGALFYEAESRTPLGSATVAVGGLVSRLTKSWQAVMSTQAASGGAHLTHVGTFRVYASLSVADPNVATATVALEWGQGDYRAPTTNAEFILDPALNYSKLIVDLGLVSLSKMPQGAQRWEGRLLAKSTVLTTDLTMDWLMFIPVDEGSGVAAGVSRNFTPTAFSARDEFDQTAGALNAKVLPVGGSWSTVGGDPDDFQITGTGTATRTAVADAAEFSGRWALAGATNFTTVAASVAMAVGTGTHTADYSLNGLLLRYVDTNNWLLVARLTTPFIPIGHAVLALVRRVGGGLTYRYSTWGSVATSQGFSGGVPALASGQTAVLGCSVTSSGQYAVSLNGVIALTGADSALATGGALATGRVGLYDGVKNSAFQPRLWNNFWVAVPPVDAAVFASQSLEVRHDGVIREDSSGSFWQPPSSYTGDLLRVPPAGAEGRTVRTIVKMSRNIPGLGPDTAADDISARLFSTPRYLT